MLRYLCCSLCESDVCFQDKVTFPHSQSSAIRVGRIISHCESDAIEIKLFFGHIKSGTYFPGLQ